MPPERSVLDIVLHQSKPPVIISLHLGEQDRFTGRAAPNTVATAARIKAHQYVQRNALEG